MADNVPITAGAGTNIATDDVSGVHYQRNKIDLGGDGIASPLVRGQQTKANSIPVTLASDDAPVLGAGTAFVGKVQLTDGTSDATVRNLAANDALNVAIVDGSGNQVTSFAGSGGTSSTDDADFTQSSTAGTPMMGVYESAPTSVTADDMGIVGIDQNRRLKVSVDASTLDVASGAADAGNPVKIGGKAISALPTQVTANFRTDGHFDRQGRQLVTEIDPGMQIWKQVEATTARNGETIWDPTSGKRIAITSYEIGTGGSTPALVTIWFGDNADLTFSQGVDQVLFRGTLTPSSSTTPGVISNLATPVYCATADRELHWTTSGNITIYFICYGFEW